MHPLSMLFGAALVALGVIAVGLADRIRGLRYRDTSPSRERPIRSSLPAQPARHPRTAIPVVDTSELLRPKQRAPRAEPKAPSSEGGDDVIAALVASGYKKQVATEAAWSCSATERATVELWTAAALRRCARGGLS